MKSLLLFLTLFSSLDAFSSPPVLRLGCTLSCPKSLAASITADMEIPPNDEDVPRLQRKLNKEFLTIALPALIQLAGEPLAGLVDTAYLGRLGPHVLGGAGVAISAHYALAKLYNDPLLRTSISLVASKDGATRAEDESDAQKKKKDLSVAVSSAILLAATVGVLQMLVYALFCANITRGMGLGVESPMWHSALSYLQVRAVGTPAATLWLVSNGIFRGLGDTRTPLIYSVIFTGLNAILDPLFIFTFGWGASGAAAGTALAQYTALIPLLRALHKRVHIDVLGQLKDLQSSLKQYLRAGSLVLFRTLGKVLCYSVVARQAALLGSVSAAAYNLTFQLGFATTQICEAVAVAVQTLLARELADRQSHSPRVRALLVRHLITTSILMGGGVAGILSMTTWWKRSSIIAGLTTDTAVQAATSSIFPVVLVCQVLKGLAYPVNGIIMGGLDWFFSMATMWLGNGIAVGLIHWLLATSGAMSLSQLWSILAVFMGTQVVTGILRFGSRTGVWKVLNDAKAAPAR